MSAAASSRLAFFGSAASRAPADVDAAAAGELLEGAELLEVLDVDAAAGELLEGAELLEVLASFRAAAGDMTTSRIAVEGFAFVFF